MSAFDRKTGLHLTLVGSPMSPHVQRVVIVLAERGTVYDLMNIDLANKPSWFTAIAPLGRVPLLRVRSGTGPERVLFESTAILEFLEDIFPDKPLHPADPVLRAEHRAWSHVAADIQKDLFQITTATTGADLDIAVHGLRSRFTRLERRLGAGPYVDGDRFGNIEAIFAPTFRQIAAVERIAPHHLLLGLEKVTAWSAAVLDRPSVRRSVPEDYDHRFHARLRMFQSLLLEPRAGQAA